MPSPTTEHRHTVSPIALAHARARVEAIGVDGAAAELCLSRGALVNVLAGIGVRRGTIAALELASLRATPSPTPQPSASTFPTNNDAA
jgi:hypothetical protein